MFKVKREYKGFFYQVKKMILGAFLILNSQFLISQTPTWKKANTQEVAQDIQSALTWFSTTENYSMVITHTSYKSFTDKVPHESVKGYYKKYKNNYHSLIAGVHTVQNEKHRFAIDTVTKYMMIANASSLAFLPEELNVLNEQLKSCTDLQMIETSVGRRYALNYPVGSATEKMEIEIFRDGKIKEIVYFLNREYKNEDLSSFSVIHPRLVISLSNYKINTIKATKEFEDPTYIDWVENKPVPAGQYSRYELFDSRVWEYGILNE